jgi:PncC family amidohydrolase
MAEFLTDEQREIVEPIASRLIERGETVAVAESTTIGLLSAALLARAGASAYYAGGGVLYTLNSRIALAGVPAETYANYRGTTPEMIASLAEALRNRLGATWCVAESGLAGPGGSRFGAPAGRTTIGVAGPVTRVEVFETGLDDREANMVEFTTLSLRLFRDVLASVEA